MRTAFLIGNKRSGTSHFVSTINLHPKVFIAPEADLIWALYCRHNKREIVPYSGDGPVGLRRTLAAAPELSSLASFSVPDTFNEVLLRMAVSAGKSLADLDVLGDKKPVQQADPEVFRFILDQWPRAKFIHLVRNPRSVVASMMKAANNNMPWMDLWKKSPEALSDAWARHEQWVLEHKARHPGRILTVRFPDLLIEAEKTWSTILNFLELEGFPDIGVARRVTEPAQDQKYEGATFPLTAEAERIAKDYDL